MKTRQAILAFSIALALALATPASAWGPTAQSSISNAAAHVLSREDNFPLTQLIKYVHEGASLPAAELDQLHQLFPIDPVGAIQREMYLLQSVRTDRIDPYYAYRLGTLGAMVVRATAPLAQTSASARREYYADVERSIDGVDLRVDRRKQVDPRAYFNLVTADAWANDQTILVDYRGGVGFSGYARSALSIDASRSVNAVADVWYTIISSAAPVFELSPSNIRDYSIGAIQFYLKLGNFEEVEEAYRDATAQGMITTAMRKSIGDLYFEAGFAERAIEEYEKVLADSPGQRDVTERISQYYEGVGDAAIARNNLEDARDAFALALNVDSLHPTAQRKLLSVEARIFARDERLISQRLATEEALSYENRAEEASVRRDYAMAISLLREAQSQYAAVTDEFPAEARVAELGNRNVGLRIAELKGELIENAQSLSGTGFRFDAQRLASQTGDRNEQALKRMLNEEYDRALEALRRRVTDQSNALP